MSMIDNARTMNRNGKWFQDSEGRFVLFRGVNLASRTKLPPYLPTIPLDIKKLDSFGVAKFHEEIKNLQLEFDKMKDLGINVIRFLVMWKAIEPEPNPHPETLSDEGKKYLELAKEIIDNLHSRGIFVIIDFHQDIAHENFGGDGFPDWVIDHDHSSQKSDDSIPDNQFWQFQYFFNSGVRETLINFWRNSEIQYNGRSYNPQDHLAKTIGATAHFFQSTNNNNGHPGILGYELFNEPISLSPFFINFENTNMKNFYKKVRQEVRRPMNIDNGEKETVDSASFLFMEPRSNLSAYLDMENDFGVLDPLTNWQWQLDLTDIADERIVFSFHYYDFVLFLTRFILNINKKEKRYKELLKELQIKALEGGGIPFLTEFGASNDWNTGLIEPSTLNTVIRASMELQYRAIEYNLLNCTYWNYDFYVTEQGKDNWNFENFSLLGPNRLERNLDIMCRPYPMKSSSEPTFLKFDIDDKHCIMKFKGIPVDAATIVFVPRSRHYKDGFDVLATSKEIEWDQNDQILVWKPDKKHNEHILIIHPHGNLDETLLSNESIDIGKLEKIIFT